MGTTKTTILTMVNYQFTDTKATRSISTRILTGAIRVPTDDLHEERYAQPPPPPLRLLDVDGLTQSIAVHDDYWGAREGMKAMWYRLAQADIFLFPFEIGNIKSVKILQEHFRLTKGMFLTNKYWRSAIVGVRTVGLDDLAPQTSGMREWAAENNAHYFEVTVDNGPSIDDMLVELIRDARHLPSKNNETYDTMFRVLEDRLRAWNRKGYDEHRKLYTPTYKPPDEEWKKTDKGWVAPNKVQATNSSGSRSCAIV